MDRVTKPRVLVVELQSYLQLTRCVLLARDFSECCVRNGRIRNIENNVVEEVECIDAEFEVSLLSEPYGDLTEHGQVDFVTHLRGIRVHLLSAIGVRRRLREGACVEPLLPRADPGTTVRVANDIHSLLEAAAYILRVAARGHGVDLSRAELHYAAEYPSTSRIGDQLIGRLGEW